MACARPIALVMLATLLGWNTARAADPPPPPTVAQILPAEADPPFEGWGVSLAWWAKVAGGYPEPARSRLMDQLFDARVGLGLNVVRYNIGGGENPDRHTLEFRAAVPGFEPAPGRWDWSADANQRWVLAAAIHRGADRLQAFSNSPPWWMTRSGTVAGGKGGGENLRPESFAPFADYLATVVQHFHDQWGVTFGTLEPVNEPCSNWWRDGGKQEGCRFDRPAQDRIVGLVGQALRDRRLSTTVAASDENSIDDAVQSFLSLSDPSRQWVTLATTHSYGGSHRAAMAELARSYGKGLWMSEDGDDDPTGLRMAVQIVNDLRGLHPSAWVAWQAADPAPGWGFFRSALRDEADARWRVNEKYFVMANFTRHIRPGSQLLAIDDRRSIAALDAKAASLTIVSVNADAALVARTFDLSRFTTVGSRADVWRTTAGEECAPTTPASVRDRRFTYALPGRSVTTFVVTRTTYAGPPAVPDANAAYHLRDGAGRWLSIAGQARTPGARVTTSADPVTPWGLLGVGGGRYAVYNRSDGLALDVTAERTDAGAPVLQWPDHNGPGQRWELNTAGDGYEIRSAGSGLLLDAASVDGATQAARNGSASQRWRLIPVGTLP
jgi:O-glycosyl hydrolase